MLASLLVAMLAPLSPQGSPPLDLADATPEERLALAIDEVAHGSASVGLGQLEALAREEADPARAERIERELGRVRAWIELRDAWLGSLAGGETLLEFTYKGRKLKTRVLAFEQGELRLEKSRAPERMSPDALDALELAQQVESPGGAGDWARVYPYVLRADPRGTKLLKDDGGAAGALLADARGDYRTLLPLGAAARGLLALGARTAPATPAEIEAELAALRALLREHAGTSLVARKRPVLLDRARALLARRCDLRGTHELLRGKLEPLEGETVRLTYAFDDPRELEDFEASLYPVQAGKAFADIAVPDEPLAVAEGVLAGAGRSTLRSLFDLGAPLSVRYGLAFGTRSGSPAPIDYLAAGVCDDGDEHFVWGINLGALQLFDRGRFDRATDEDASFFRDRTYQVELRHDGERVSLLSEGEVRASLPAGARQSGAIFLRMHSEEPVRLDQLVIEGRLLPDSFARLQRAWIEREVATY